MYTANNPRANLVYITSDTILQRKSHRYDGPWTKILPAENFYGRHRLGRKMDFPAQVE
jgi:hypothetical protein